MCSSDLASQVRRLAAGSVVPAKRTFGATPIVDGTGSPRGRPGRKETLFDGAPAGVTRVRSAALPLNVSALNTIFKVSGNLTFS